MTSPASQSDLFSDTSHEPLAHRARPRTLEEYRGQEHIMGKGKLLRRAIEADMLASVILYGPAGSGKTTLARLIASHSKSRFVEINATEANVSDLRKAAEEAKNLLGIGQKTTLFIDEIHRFNRGQQDALLPHVENGTLRLIGATTQNPFFAINSPLVSRSQIFQLEPLSQAEIQETLRSAAEKFLPDAEIEPEALAFLAAACDGDARRALNGLELAYKTGEPTVGGKVGVRLQDAADSIQRKPLRYDPDGDNHYDTISAFIKSMRGSDPDATLYWLARMLESGEEPRYIARRLVIHAAEDVGLADPSALQTATAAQSAVETIGLPEAKIPLAMAALHIALAPKSNSACAGISAACQYVREHTAPEVPMHLRDTHYEGAAQLGNGQDYLYPHDAPNGFCGQGGLPEGVPAEFYRPGERGTERELNERLAVLRELAQKKTTS